MAGSIRSYIPCPRCTYFRLYKDAADLEPPQCSPAGIGEGTRAAGGSGGSGAAMAGRGGVGFIFVHRVDDRRNGAAHAAGFYVCCFKGLFGGFHGVSIEANHAVHSDTGERRAAADAQTPATTRLQLRVLL